MAVWRCEDCGFSKESRCKPKKCPVCGKARFAKDGENGECEG